MPAVSEVGDRSISIAAAACGVARLNSSTPPLTCSWGSARMPCCSSSQSRESFQVR